MQKRLWGVLAVLISLGGATSGVVAIGDRPQTVSETAVPLPPHLKPFATGKEVEDVADVAQQDLRAGGNPDMRYALIGPRSEDKTPPPKGYKLLLVLPGGDGSPDFNPFVRRIAKNAVPPNYLVAQLVAPVWTKEQSSQIVWPTRRLTVPGTKFTTEAFIEAVIKDTKGRFPVDTNHIVALGWSSGGPPVYATLLSENSSLTGAFVAMSIFHPSDLPPLSGAKGKAVYLLHSPQDFIKITDAKAARDQLAVVGAKTTLTTYRGGHGWREDPFGHITRGLAWLEHPANEERK